MIVQRMSGRAGITAPGLKPSAKRVKALTREFGWVTWSHVRREKNKMADCLENATTRCGKQNTGRKCYDERGLRST